MELKSLRYLQPPAPGAQGLPPVQPRHPATASAQLSPSQHYPKTDPPTPPGPAKAKSINGQLPGAGVQEVFGTDPNFKDFASIAATHKGLKPDPWASACGTPGGTHCYRWRGRRGDAGGEPSPPKLCRTTRRVRVGPWRGTLPASAPHASQPSPLSVQGWIHNGAELTELKQVRIKLMARTGRNSRAPGGSLLRLRASPTEGKPPAASGLLQEQLQFHTQQSNISQYPSFPAGEQPRLLLARLPPLQRPTSTAGPHPAHTDPRLRLQGTG